MRREHLVICASGGTGAVPTFARTLGEIVEEICPFNPRHPERRLRAAIEAAFWNMRDIDKLVLDPAGMELLRWHIANELQRDAERREVSHEARGDLSMRQLYKLEQRIATPIVEVTTTPELKAMRHVLVSALGVEMIA